MIKAQTMKQIRRVHHYVGVFFTPAILLFALSGALQTFRLQEEKGYGGTPPAWIAWMASVHKDSMLPRDRAGEKEKERPATATAKRVKIGAEGAKATPAPSRLPMQIFVAVLSIGLIVSALLGVMIALNNRTTRRTSVVMLAIGALLPLLLMLV